MLKNRNIVCFSSIDWDFIWQGHQEIMSTFAKNDSRVLFIENTGVRPPNLKDMPRIKSRIRNWFKGVKGIRKEADNLYVFSPLILPFPYSRIARLINCRLILSVLEKWMQAVDFTDPIIWVFLPTGLTLDLINHLDKKMIIYYCLDNLKKVDVSTKRIEKYEKKVIQKSDLVFVTSDALHGYCAEVRCADQIYKFPFTVNIAKFDRNKINSLSAPPDLKGIKRPIIGFSGGVRKWIDRDLIKYLLSSNPEFSFVFVGPIQMDIRDLSCFKNAYFLGQKTHDELPVYINNFDAAIIPYLVNDFTRCIFPAKLNEYLALGKPVISTDLPELKEMLKKYGDNIIHIADTKEKFSDRVKLVLKSDDEVAINKRIQAAKENSWEYYIEKMSDLIEKKIEEKRLDTEEKWKENLLVFYRKSRKKVFKFATICILLYIFLFKTSFIWLVASPLKISQPPHNANAIVVFGGGVGETGSPGKSTIERARYAVELFKKGYADYVIFSSGYTYKYNDAENMKLFAVSMGVPEKNIILEDKSSSTYENVMFSKNILDKKGWNSILLVSSPYNMRRASLIFRKYGNRLKIFYLPVKENQFFDRTEGVKLEQINAIFHEYAGIIYYWLRGYI